MPLQQVSEQPPGLEVGIRQPLLRHQRKAFEEARRQLGDASIALGELLLELVRRGGPFDGVTRALLEVASPRLEPISQLGVGTAVVAVVRGDLVEDRAVRCSGAA